MKLERTQFGRTISLKTKISKDIWEMDFIQWMQEIQTWFFFFIFCQHSISWASSISPLQLSMCSRHRVNRWRPNWLKAKPQMALATTSNLTETARWEDTEKQVFLISRALRAPSWEQDEQLLSREIKKIPRTVAITRKHTDQRYLTSVWHKMW